MSALRLLLTLAVATGWASSLLAATIVLPYGGGPDTVTLSRPWGHRSVDVGLLIDATGTMMGEASNLKSGMSTLFASLQANYPDLRMGIAVYMDWPCSPHGVAGDLPFQLRQRCTSNMTALIFAINAISPAPGSGGDGPESGCDALHYAITGLAGAAPACGATAIAAFNPSSNQVPGVADGAGGGMGFRDDGRATQVLIQFTDDESKDSVSCAFSGPVGRPRALAELVAHQCRFGAVYSGVAGNTGHNQLRQLSEVSSTITPPAYGVSPVFCETGINGTGMTPIGGGCPNVFELSSAGTGASTAAAQAVIEALDASPFRLTSSAAGTPTPGGSSTDFLQSAEFVAAGNPSFAPAPVLSPSAIDGSFATGTYDLRLILENLDVPPGSSAQTFPLYVHVLAGNAVVARDTLLIEVPGPVGVGSPHGGSPLTLRSLTENPFATDWAASWCCRTKARPG